MFLNQYTSIVVLTQKACITLILMACCLSDKMRIILASKSDDDIAEKTAMLKQLYSEVVINSSRVIDVSPLANCRDTYTIMDYTDLYDKIYHSEFQPVWACKQVIKIFRLPEQGSLMMYVCIDTEQKDFPTCAAPVLIRTETGLVKTDTIMCVAKPGVLLEMTSLVLEINIVTSPPTIVSNLTSELFIHFYHKRDLKLIGASSSSIQQTTAETASSDEWMCDNGTMKTQSPDALSCYKQFHSSVIFHKITAVSYNVASKMCAEHGSHLVHIDSEAENTFIWEHDRGPVESQLLDPYNYNYYIGLQRNALDQWIWLSSERVINYGKMYLDGYSLDKCAVIGNMALWYPTPCEFAKNIRGFVCERENPGYSKYVDTISADVTKTSTVESENEDMSTTQEYQETNMHALLPLYVGITLLVLLCTSALFAWRICKKSETKKPESIPQISVPLELSPIMMKSLTQEVQHRLKTLLLSRDDLDIQEELGRGAFGAVSKGTITRHDGGVSNVQTVAIKSLTGNYMGSDITAFVNEAITMAELQHPHVLSIIGVCIDSKSDVPMIILPYMANGDLRTYLRTLRRNDKSGEDPPDENQLLLFCLHISMGMKYLSNQKIIHRDLAARNCMVDSELLVKVADFGLARDVYSDSYYRQDQQKLLPVRWMAIECLHDHVFSIQSDIWSFGVAMWEVFSLGRVPYMHLENANIAAHLQTGNRLEQPELCPTEMHTLMMKCFKNSPSERPSFTEITEKISNYIAQMCDYIDVNDDKTESDDVCLDKKTEGCVTQQIEIERYTAHVLTIF